MNQTERDAFQEMKAEVAALRSENDAAWQALFDERQKLLEANVKIAALHAMLVEVRSERDFLLGMVAE